MSTFSDKLLIEARNDSLQLEQVAVADLDRNVDGYLPPNWRVRQMVGAWGRYVASNGFSTEDDYMNMRAAYTETQGRSNKVFSDVLATHTRQISYDMSKTMFGDYATAGTGKEDAAVMAISGEDDMVQSDDAWKNVVQSAHRHLELYGWWKSKVRAPDALVKNLRKKVEARLERTYGDKLKASYEGADNAEMQLKIGTMPLLQIEEMYEFGSDPLLLSIVQKYLGVPPILNTPVAFLNSFVKAKGAKDLSNAAQLYHHDMHRLGFVKAFIYLTDVGPDSGPHTLLPGTHRSRPDALWADGRHGDAAIKKAGIANLETQISGPAGTVFLVDTSCLHKGSHPLKEARLMAQVQYTNSLFGRPIGKSTHRVEVAQSTKAESAQKTAALVRKYAEKSGVRFMQNYI